MHETGRGDAQIHAYPLIDEARHAGHMAIDAASITAEDYWVDVEPPPDEAYADLAITASEDEEAPDAADAPDVPCEAVVAEQHAADVKSPEAPTLGDDTLAEIRDMYRQGDMAASRPVQYRIAARHKKDREQVAGWVGEWYEANPDAQVNVPEVKHRFSDTWLKYSLVPGKNTTAVLGDRPLVEETLGAYNTDIIKTKGANLRNAEAIALYNTPSELAEALALTDKHDYLTPGVVKRRIEHSKTDVLSGMGELIDKVEVGLARYPDGRQLDMRALLRFADTTKPDKFIDRIDRYVGDVATLEDKYQDSKHVTPGRIRNMALNSADPAKAIEDRMELADRLFAENQGVKGLLRGEITEMCFNKSDPTRTIERYVENLPLVEQAHPELPFGAIRRLCLDEEQPLEKAGLLAKNVEQAKRDFPDVSGWIMDIAARASDNPARYLQERFKHIGPFKELYGELVEGVHDSRLHNAVLRTDHPDEQLRGLISDQLLAQARAERQAHPKSIQASRAMAGAMAELSANARMWAGDAIPEGIDMDDAVKRFGRVWQAHARDNPAWFSDTKMAKAMWDTYWEDTVRLKDAGFARPAALAEYNGADGLVELLLKSPTPGISANVVDARITDPLGRHAEYDDTLHQLTRQFAGERFATKSLLQFAAKGYPSDPVGAVENQLEKLRALPGEFDGMVGVDDDVYAYFAHNIQTDPAAGVRAYVDRYKALALVYIDDSDFGHDALREISLHTRSTDLDNLREHGEMYKERLEQIIHEGVFIDEDLMQRAAARKAGSTFSRLGYARYLQKERNNQPSIYDTSQPEAIRTIEDKASDASSHGTDPQIQYEDWQDEEQARMERRYLLAHVLSEVTDAERQLLTYTVGGVTEGVDVALLKRQLRTTDIDAYTAELLRRLRRIHLA